MSAIPAMWKANWGGSGFEASFPRQKHKTVPEKNKLKQNGLVMWLKW
jgi:hypothetical protein